MGSNACMTYAVNCSIPDGECTTIFSAAIRSKYTLDNVHNT